MSEQWETVPFLVSGVRVGASIVQGTEIHFALSPQWRPRASARAAVRAHLAPLLERRGFLTTRVLHSRQAQQRFVQRVGFTPTWSDGQTQFYMLTELPFGRTKRNA